MANGIIQFQIESGIPVPAVGRQLLPMPANSCGLAKCRRIPRDGYKTCDYHLNRMKEWRLKVLRRGFCAYGGGCRQAPKTGHTLCSNHLKALIVRSQKMRASRKANGMCARCNKRPGWFGIYCVLCRILGHRVAPNSLPVGAKRALKQFRRLESINDRRTQAERAVGFIVDSRARDIIAMRHGLVDAVDWTLEEIGASLGVTRERVRQIETRALAELEHLGVEINFLRPPFVALQRPKKKPSHLGDHEKKKNRAHKLVEKAIQEGVIIKRPCQVCGLKDAIAHHADYDKPLEIQWLCRPHHAEAHGGKARPPRPQPRNWIDKLHPVFKDYNAPLLVAIIKRAVFSPRLGVIARATGLDNTTIKEVLSGACEREAPILEVLRYVDGLTKNKLSRA